MDGRPELCESQAFKASGQLVGDEFRVDTVFQLRVVLDQFFEGGAVCLLLAAQGKILALQVTHLGNDDDLVACQGSGLDQRFKNLPHEQFAAAIRVIGACVDQVDAP